MRSRNRERIGEAVSVRVSSPGSSGDVDVERKQVANGAVVFGAIETVDGGDAAVFGFASCAIDLALEPGGCRVIGRVIRTRTPGWRHRAGAQLRDHLLPGFGVGSRRRESRSRDQSAVRSFALWQLTHRSASILERRRGCVSPEPAGPGSSVGGLSARRTASGDAGAGDKRKTVWRPSGRYSAFYRQAGLTILPLPIPALPAPPALPARPAPSARPELLNHTFGERSALRRELIHRSADVRK